MAKSTAKKGAAAPINKPKKIATASAVIHRPNRRLFAANDTKI